MLSSAVRQGLQDAAPIALAYFPIAMTFGVITVQCGLPVWLAVLISVAVYAGGAQFMLVSLVSSGAPFAATVATVLLVNLRHALYGTTLGPAFTRWPERKKWLAAFGLTDEVFAVTSGRLLQHPPDPAAQMTLSFTCYASWVAGTFAGAVIGQAAPAGLSADLNFALPALFLALLLMSITSLAHLAAALTGAAAALVCTWLQAGGAGIVIGAILGATVGAGLSKWINGPVSRLVPNRPSSRSSVTTTTDPTARR
ncbi:MAG: AzlC family ABC transporter permease [Alicyclobacillus macrosporangiidus]|uniref:AzlC family ABC transporter permease n=1 Tax=Alicyclobacillus macrosporangiidus TaxID=392015 RepID=UPI0026F14B22|nr:AzlC family ABC transporter permease [Alicyclobacillus macrosporangiidus]MCL6601112.1 AzlC family ABC transporter permease [Alicyclobacillus macrosporangiidus]